MRYDPNVPILIPEANHEKIDLIRNQGYPQTGFCVTNANCVTTGLAMAVAPLRKYGIKTITVNSYQSVSGAGYPGLSSFDITDNCIPYIGGEEEKIEKEVKKILSIDPDVYAYTVRVPVMFGHLETVWLDFEQDVTPEMVIEDWKNFNIVPELPSTPAQAIEYSSENTFPQPKYAFWGNPKGMVIYTGRLKKKNGRIGFCLMVNNIVKGAAGGSIQNAELFVKQYGLICRVPISFRHIFSHNKVCGTGSACGSCSAFCIEAQKNTRFPACMHVYSFCHLHSSSSILDMTVLQSFTCTL